MVEYIGTAPIIPCMQNTDPAYLDTPFGRLLKPDDTVTSQYTMVPEHFKEKFQKEVFDVSASINLFIEA